MIQGLIICAFFALMYAIKGGSGKTIFPWWAALRAKNAFTERLLDGKVISTICVFLFSLVATSEIICRTCGLYGVPEYDLPFVSWAGSAAFAAAWLLSVAPSMGEEHGAIGRIGRAWGDYMEYPESFGRAYGVKKGIQRGVWIGACLTVVTGFIPYIYFSLLFVPAVFIGQQIGYMIFKRDGWVLSEPIIGALVYGIPTAIWLAG